VTLLMALLLTAAGPDPDAADWRAGLPASLSSEEPQDQETRKEREAREARESRDRSEDRGPKWGLGVQLQGRWSLPFGSANRDIATFSNPGGGATVTYDSSLSWSDLFGSGWGTSLTVEVTMVRAGRGDGGYGRSKNNFTVGGYLSFLQDHFTGETVSDGAGNTISAEDLTMETYLVGGTMYQNMGNNVYYEGRLGIGAVHYSQVNGMFSTGFPFNNTFEGNLFKETWNFAMEVRGGFGYKLGPLGLSVGMGFRLMAPPSAGSGVALDSGVLMTWDIDLGVELGF